jgi:ATPase subunit of ABC transporter with duplicated ATPase domains
MVPATKRPRLSSNDGDFIVEEVASASSNLRAHNPKKAKISKRRSSVVPGMSGEDEDEEESDYSNSTLDRSPRKVQREDSESESEEDDRPEASQAVQEQLRLAAGRHGENVPEENGIIESVTCINFMCHTRLEVSLGPLINFIIGHNGSGKSAVLTALTICLGGKASSTNRGQSLKDFIKEGQE